MRVRRVTKVPQPKVGRLAIQFGVVFALAMGFAGVLMFFIAEARLTAEVDKSLLRDRDRLLGSPSPAPDSLALPKLTRRIAEWETKRTISDKGHVVFDAAGHPLFGNIALAMPPEGYSAVTFRDGDGVPREGRAYRQQLGGGTSLVIVAHSEIVEDLNAILPPLAVALSLTIAAAGIAATWLFARQIAVRLVETQLAADAIANGNLKRRVPMNRLDGMFAVQAASFNRMLDRMEEMLKVQRQFASNLAHDLRTPLTRLRGLLAAPDGDHGRMVQRAERECASIIAIFDALLRLSEIEAGRHPTALGPLSFKNVIEDVTESMEPVLGDNGSALVVGPLGDLAILADGPLIHQLLVNLLENIALHTPPGTTAQVSLREDRTRAMAMLTIADDGPGLPTNERARVLQPFERGSTSDKVSGSGLGLAIAQAIVRFHRGELRLTDNRPGLAVEIRLPMVGIEPPASLRERSELVG
ncbi:HAMP domain-containing sensor histidine kinase [Novosphingobium sp. G106]|uniref:sensor histidine kinase n=1 Tax=Novosphingobium sp. G106 TaxID=2849500 RepID=UPI0028111227|nr:HAMP domain-containing sensor histidine kinase [Novosphingobium sp. G106]